MFKKILYIFRVFNFYVLLWTHWVKFLILEYEEGGGRTEEGSSTKGVRVKEISKR